MRPFRRLDDYERALALVEAEHESLAADAELPDGRELTPV
jgi:hypothetical protein